MTIADSPKPALEQVTVCVLSGDQKINRFMRGFDVFEQSKTFALPEYFSLEIPAGTDLQSVVDDMRAAIERQQVREVVAVFVAGTAIGSINRDVKLVSDGQCFGPLQRVLSELGFQGDASGG